MTEEEAKTLASELEHHPRYRVTRVYEFYAFHWAIDFCRRDDPTYRGTLYGPIASDLLRELLSADDPSELPWLYPNHRSTLDKPE